MHRGQYAIGAFERIDFGLREHFDIGKPADTVDEIARHGRSDIVAAHQHPDFRDMLGEKHRGLAGRIPGADQHDVLIGAQPRFDPRGPIVNAGALAEMSRFSTARRR